MKTKKSNWLIMLVIVLASGIAFAGGDAEQEAAPQQTGTTAAADEIFGEPGQFADQWIYATVADFESATGRSIDSYQESPMLAERVSQGTLPPVEERLPAEPLVLVPLDEIGQYGGTMNRAWTGPSDKWGLEKLTVERVIRFHKDGDGVVPNIFKSWTINEEGTVYTFSIREGVKWSDGVPFTADDVMFYYEDIRLNKEINPVLSGWLRIGDEEVVVEKVDDYTVQFFLPAPSPLFLLSLAQNGAFYAPRHYLRQFHADYADEATLDSMVRDAGFDRWTQLIADKGAELWDLNVNPDAPTLNAWKLVTDVSAGVAVMERNPYYWKVDIEGNQLPYIDEIAHQRIEDAEIAGLMAMTGQIDFQARHMQITDFTVFMENREQGGYEVRQWPGATGASPYLLFNTSHKDLWKRELYRTLEFRQAISLTINREEINDLVYKGLGEPRQASIVTGAAYYSEEWEKAWADFDLERASEMLDDLGLDARDSDGYRLRPDGEPFVITLDMTNNQPWIDSFELITGHWDTIGIRSNLNVMERSLRLQRQDANELETEIWGLDKLSNYLAQPARMILNEGYGYDWYVSGGDEGIEPSDAEKELHEVWNLITITTDDDARDALAERLVEIHKENLWYIGTVGEMPSLAIVKNNVGNVPEVLINDDTLRTPGNAEPSQFFFRQN